MVAWKNIPIFALAVFLPILAGSNLARAQGADAQVVNFTFREISLGETFKTAMAKAKKLKFEFLYLSETLPKVPDFIRTRDCVSKKICDSLLIYFNFTKPVGYVSRIIYSHPVEASLNTKDVIQALEESYGPSAMKVKENGKSYIQWGGDNQPKTFDGTDIEKTPELIGGRYVLATILKDKHGTLNLTLEITDSRQFIDGKHEMNRLVKLKAKQEKEVAIKKMRFR